MARALAWLCPLRQRRVRCGANAGCHRPSPLGLPLCTLLRRARRLPTRWPTCSSYIAAFVGWRATALLPAIFCSSLPHHLAMADKLSTACYHWGTVAYVVPAATPRGCADREAATVAAATSTGGEPRSRRVGVVAKRRRASVMWAPDRAGAGVRSAVGVPSRQRGGRGRPPHMTADGPSGTAGRGAGEGGEGEEEPEDNRTGAGEGAAASETAPSGAAYVPTQEDLPEGVGDELPTKLTLSQQLLLKQYIEQVQTMSEQQCKELTLEVVRFLVLCLLYFGREVQPRPTTGRGAQ